MDTGYCYSFPATRGMQANKPFYIAMCPMRIIPRIFIFDGEEVPPQLRSQRRLNAQRVPEIARYLVEKPGDYVLSALTASVDASVKFDSVDPEGAHSNLGTLNIPMDARMLINDGQHRRAAIEEAIKENPDLGHHNVAVLFFIDQGLNRSQQMFVDLNMHQVRPNTSLVTLYNHTDSESVLATEVATECAPFDGLTDLENSSLAKKSNKLFTLSSIKHANRALLKKSRKDKISDRDREITHAFWNELSSILPFWKLTKEGKIAASSVREDNLFSHGVIIQALGTLGSYLLSQHPTNWKQYIAKLSGIDWSKSNPLWNNRVITHGRVTKSRAAILLTVNALKNHLHIDLDPEERALEESLNNEQ